MLSIDEEEEGLNEVREVQTVPKVEGLRLQDVIEDSIIRKEENPILGCNVSFFNKRAEDKVASVFII